MAECRQQTIDADRGTDCRNALAVKAGHEVVIPSAPEHRPELRGFGENRLEDRTGVVGETAGDGKVERDLVVVVAEGVEVVGDFCDVRDGRCIGEQLLQLGDDLAARAANGQELLDFVDLLPRQSDAADGVARFVFVAGHELELHLLETDLVELVEDAKHVDALFRGDLRESHQRIENAAAGVADHIAADLQGVERVAHPGDDLRIRNLGLDTDGIEIELGELAIAPLVRLVGSPDRGDLVTAEGAGEIGVLGDDARERHGQIEAEPQFLFFRIGDPKDRRLRFLARAAGEDVEVLDRGRAQRNEAVELIDATDGVHHLLPRQHLVGKEIA